MSESSVAANGAGPMPAISMMRKPASGPIVVTFLGYLFVAIARKRRIAGDFTSCRYSMRWAFV
jgi:hypothetical protein